MDNMEPWMESYIRVVDFDGVLTYGWLGGRRVKINLRDFQWNHFVGPVNPEARVQDWDGEAPSPGPCNQAEAGAIAPAIEAEGPPLGPREVVPRMGSPHRNALRVGRDRLRAKPKKEKGRKTNEKKPELQRGKMKMNEVKKDKEKMEKEEMAKMKKIEKDKMERKKRADKRKERAEKAEKEEGAGGHSRKASPTPEEREQLRRWAAKMHAAKAKKVFRGRK